MDTTEQSTALPNGWIAALFRRFRLIYGSRLDSMWAGTEAAELTNAWATELAPFEGDDIRLALEAMRFAYKDFPPTLFQFADLCLDAKRRRVQGTRKLEYSTRTGPIDARVLAEVHKFVQHQRDSTRDPRDWARRILQREDAGERIPVYALFCAREALGIAPYAA